jgi:hypothetical protein
MMGVLTLLSNRTAAIDCLAQQRPLFRRAVDSMQTAWQHQLAAYDRDWKVNSLLVYQAEASAAQYCEVGVYVMCALREVTNQVVLVVRSIL